MSAAASHLMKLENIPSFSDHDYEVYMQKEGTIAEDIDIVEDMDMDGNGNDYYQDEGRRTPRRNAKKPQAFVPGVPKKLVANKRKKSIGIIGAKRGSKIGIKKEKKEKGKNGKEQSPKYEVDYIFGKRPDMDQKGKFEYRVLWKNYPRSAASWEPEDNLRFCSEAIQAYELGQSAEGVEMGDEEGGKVTMRKNKGKKGGGKRTTRSRSVALTTGHQSKSKGTNKLLATMRARSTSVLRKVTSKGRKSVEGKSKETSPALSHSTSDSSNSKKTNLPAKKKMAKGGGPSQPSTTHSAGHSRAKSESAGDKGNEGGGISNAQNIAIVENVARSDIEGVGLIAKVIFKDGSSKKMTVDSFKSKAADVLIEYYERTLGLI